MTAILPGCHQFGDSSSLIVYPVNFDRVPRANPNTLIFERVRRAGSHSIFSVADGTAIRRPIWASTYATAGGVVDKNVRGCIKSTARAPLHAAAHRFFGTFQVKAENTPVNPHRKRQNRPGAVFRVRGTPAASVPSDGLQKRKPGVILPRPLFRLYSPAHSPARRRLKFSPGLHNTP